MEKQISIIIPTYNMEAYIAKCLDSLLISDFDKVEVWVVNDGSEDSSSQIAHSYADRYPESIHVIDKENGNYGSCVNAALPLCTARYVKILDADDSFDTVAFAELVRMLPNIQDDVIISNFVKVNELGFELEKIVYSNSNIKTNYTYSMDVAATIFFRNYVAMYCLTYKIDIFKTIEYRQSEGISYTDVQWAIVPLSNCENVRFLDLCIYKYLTGRTGQSTEPLVFYKSIPQLIKMLQDMDFLYERLKGMVRQREFLLMYIADYQYKTCRWIAGFGKEYMKLICQFDSALEKISQDIYIAIGQIPYDSLVRYKYFRGLRKSAYNDNYKIPKRVLLELSIKIRMIKLRTKLFK